MTAGTAGTPGTPGTPGADRFVRLEGISAADVTAGQLRTATLPNGTRLCVGQHEGAVFAMKDECPHAEFPLSEGTLYPNGELECSWHGARFNCLSGAVLRGPAEDPLVQFDVEERDGALWVRRTARVPR